MGNKIAVIGSGGWGTALAVLLSAKGYDVALWSWQKEESERLREDRENKEFLPGVTLPDKISFTHSLAEAADGAELIVCATPSAAVRGTAKNLSPHVKQGQIVVSASKGLEISTLKTLSQVIGEEIPQAEVAVMSGPSHAEEVARFMPTTNVVASHDEEIAKFVQNIFMHPTFRVYTNPDALGVELGGALKNVIALCAGISDGLGFGDNTKAALMTRGMAEIRRLGVAMGARAETFAGLSGMGDLIVTCTSMHSRNRRAGILIGQGKSLDEALKEVHMVVEGVNTTFAAYELSRRYGIEMPIVNEAYAILTGRKKPAQAVEALMERERKSESEAEFLT